MSPVSYGQNPPVKPGSRWSVIEWEAFTDEILRAVLLPGQH